MFLPSRYILFWNTLFKYYQTKDEDRQDAIYEVMQCYIQRLHEALKSLQITLCCTTQAKINAPQIYIRKIKVQHSNMV